jgi:cytochrome c-type biogenesis protein CcmH
MRRAAETLFALMLACGLANGVAHAVEPDEMLADPGLEQRARDIGQQLRCLVCQNQSIDDSQAELARDLRVLVRQRLQAGDSDRQVVDFVVARYGDFVLLKPPVNKDTLALWFGPAALAALGLTAIAVYFARKPKNGPAPLDAAERERLQALLGEDP